MISAVRFAGLAAAVFLTACATEPPQSPAVSAGGNAELAAQIDSAELQAAAPLGRLTAAETATAMKRRRSSLSQLLQPQLARGDIQSLELDNERLRVKWRAGVLFDSASAELQPAALEGLSRLAKWVRADGAVVVQIVGRLAGADADALGERRIAALSAFLANEGALPERLRAQLVDVSQRAAHTQGGEFEVLIVPVVDGREAMAWVPPALD